ncbi:DUF1190 domain-containing protein [Ferrovibrio sp.]|uniref:DUF1190 domain-containing protein n=1 Tax=Ferrovibrio sp. TaxID=1917215 RepID=UPI0035132310
MSRSHPRRKSRVIRLALMGTVGLVGLTGCEEKDPLAGQDVIRDQAECSSKADPDACRMALADAREAHLRSAPRFASLTDCEDRFGLGNCGTPQQVLAGNDAFRAAQPAAGTAPQSATPQQTAPQEQTAQGSGSLFMPMLMGYMLGRGLGGTSPWAAQPLYRDPGNTVYSGNRNLGQLSTSRFPDAPKATPASIARGGFGTTGRAFTVAG